MTASTAFAESEIIVVNTYGLRRKTLRNDTYYLGSRAVFYGTAINDKCIHINSSNVNNKPNYIIIKAACQALNQRMTAEII